MKKQIMFAIAKLTFIVLFVMTVAGACAQTSAAMPAEKNAQINYLGTQEGMVLFNVTFDNPSGNKFTITVVDEEGFTIYQQASSDKKFDKRFKLLAPDNSKLTFVIKNAKETTLTQSFEINTHVVEDVIVTRVK
jgi:hypothetical protein